MRIAREGVGLSFTEDKRLFDVSTLIGCEIRLKSGGPRGIIPFYEVAVGRTYNEQVFYFRGVKAQEFLNSYLATDAARRVVSQACSAALGLVLVRP